MKEIRKEMNKDGNAEMMIGNSFMWCFCVRVCLCDRHTYRKYLSCNESDWGVWSISELGKRESKRIRERKKT